jgi:hypothetical protein
MFFFSSLAYIIIARWTRIDSFVPTMMTKSFDIYTKFVRDCKKIVKCKDCNFFCQPKRYVNHQKIVHAFPTLAVICVWCLEAQQCAKGAEFYQHTLLCLQRRLREAAVIPETANIACENVIAKLQHDNRILLADVRALQHDLAEWKNEAHFLREKIKNVYNISKL